MNYRIYKRVFLENIQDIVKTKHMVEGSVMPRPHQLQIVQYLGDENVYLLYCNSKGEEITDTFHENIEDAMSQAAWEFNIKESDWEDL